MAVDPTIRQVTTADSTSLSFLVNNAEYIYRHLDWRKAMDWIGTEPFLALETHRRLLAALACPREQYRVGWIRLFAFLNWNTPELETSWNLLFQEVCDIIHPSPDFFFAALGLHPWFSTLLRSSGFYHRQDIVVLQWLGDLPDRRPLPSEVTIRPMQAGDLPEVLAADNLAFDPLWQHSKAEIELAFQQAAYASVAEMNGDVIGYQVSTGTPYHAHLARLAVDPSLQRLSIGYNLVYDLLHHFHQAGIPNITVNTQSDNLSSLALYKKIGFQRTGDDFPVFIFPHP
jgi:[ribosomal protein S18]-alanine N-acetyltransferase